MNTSRKSDHSTSSPLPYSEHRVPRGDFTIYARHYPGTGPAFVLMHGFPDNLHLYDRLIPLLHGRQVITFDFLGWGASDKPDPYTYTSKGQEQDLQAVLDVLHVEQVVPVAHDASGPVTINWALDHPERISSLVLLNTYYGYTPTLRFPEWVNLFADPEHAVLVKGMTENPVVAEWLFRFQRVQFTQAFPRTRGSTTEGLWEIIWPQFVATPSSWPAVISLTSDLHATLGANTQRLPELKEFARPVRIIFGTGDPYLNTGVAQSLHEALPTSDLSLLHQGHWLQLDGAAEVAELLLSLPEASRA